MMYRRTPLVVPKIREAKEIAVAYLQTTPHMTKDVNWTDVCLTKARFVSPDNESSDVSNIVVINICIR
jgi:hypothetical protein